MKYRNESNVLIVVPEFFLNTLSTILGTSTKTQQESIWGMLSLAEHGENNSKKVDRIESKVCVRKATKTTLINVNEKMIHSKSLILVSSE